MLSIIPNDVTVTSSTNRFYFYLFISVPPWYFGYCNDSFNREIHIISKYFGPRNLL